MKTNKLEMHIYIYVKVCRLKVILRASLSSPNGLLALPSKYSSAQLYYRLTPNNSLFSVPFSNIKHLLLWALHSWTKGAGTAIGAATLHVWADVIFSSHMQIHMLPFPFQQQPKELALQLPKVMLLLVLFWWLILGKYVLLCKWAILYKTGALLVEWSPIKWVLLWWVLLPRNWKPGQPCAV